MITSLTRTGPSAGTAPAGTAPVGTAPAGALYRPVTWGNSLDTC